MVLFLQPTNRNAKLNRLFLDICDTDVPDWFLSPAPTSDLPAELPETHGSRHLTP
jgi:hypothetical protein